MGYDVLGVPFAQDNYAWVLTAGPLAAVIDPGDAGVVRSALEARGLRLCAIFITHHHTDHVGGIEGLLDAYPGATVHAGAGDVARGRIPGSPVGHAGGARVAFGGAMAEVVEVPGHTRGHIAWRFEDGRAFVGDTVFVAGCGRLFEGTAEELDRSVNDVILAWPPATELYCAHEYTLGNLRFAATVDAHNPARVEAERRAIERRAEGLPTVPTTVAAERATNPFARLYDPAVRGAVGVAPDAPRAVAFAALRAAKDRFR